MDQKETTDTAADNLSEEISSFEEYNKDVAKEKASILWLLSKAFDGVIPSDLREPFYRDHEKQIRLKPKIVHSLANAELYCLSLANIYADPNYHSLDHHGIIQTLARKGIYLVKTKDAPLTETVLVQTAPIRLNAHMAVIDGIMSLYIKEVLIPEKIIEVVRSFSYVNLSSETPSNAEEAAVLWINKCCRTLENEIKQKADEKESSCTPRIPVLQEISDISDGCSLAAVISFYCPNYISWQDICWNEQMSLSDSIYNFKLIRMFCKSLPRDIYFLTLEDFLYLHPSIKENVLAFVADLLYLFVICPADCVTRSFRGPSDNTSHAHLEDSRSPKNLTSTHKAQVPCSPIPNLRADSYGGSTSSLPDRVGSRGFGGQKEKLLDKHSNFRKSSLSNEICDMSVLHRTGSADIVNGKSPNTSEPSLSSAGKYQRHYRSGDGTLSYDGSQSSFMQSPTRMSEKNELRGDDEPISNSGYGKKLEPKDITYSRRKFNNSLSHGANVVENSIFQNANVSHGRQSVCLEDYYKKLGTEDGILRSSSTSSIGEHRNWRNCNDKFILESNFQRNHAMVLDPCGTFSRGVCIDDINNKNAFSTTSFAEISKFKGPNSNAINIVYMQHDRDDNNPERDKHPLKSSFLQKQKEKHKSSSSQEKRTTFAALPNTTTWQEQQAVSSNSPQTDSGHETPTEPGDSSLNTQLYNVRMKLEEKRRKIEQEKRRMELLWKRQRQKLGKAAFLQAVSKSGPTEVETPDSGTGKEVCESESPLTDRHMLASSRSPSSIRRMSIQEIAEDLDSVQKRWLDAGEAPLEKIPAVANIPNNSADIEIDDSVNINIEEFQTSIEHLNSSLNDLQADISRLSVQQEHVETLLQNHSETTDGSHFFLHDHYPLPQVTDSLQDSLQWDERGAEVTEPLGQPSHWEPRTLIQHESIPAQVPSRKTILADLQYEKSSASLSPVKKELDPSNECLYSKVVKKDAYGHPLNLSRPQVHDKRQFYVSHLGPDSASASAQKPTHNLPSSPVVPDNRKSSGFTDSLRQSSLSPRHISHLAKEKPRTARNGLSTGSIKPQGKDSLRAVDQKEQKSKTGLVAERDEVDDASIGASSFPAVSPTRGMHPAKQAETPNRGDSAFGFVIGADLVHPDPETENEMARKKEMIMLMSLRRRADQETKRVAKEQENARRREQEERKKEYMEKKREEERLRRQAILEQYRQRKIQEELEKEGGTAAIQPMGSREQGTVSRIGASKPSKSRATSKPRPKSAYILSGGSDQASLCSLDSQANKRNSCYLTSGGDGHDFDTDSLNSTSTTSSQKAASPSHISNHVLPQGASSPGGTSGSKDTGPSSDGTSDTASTTSSAVAAEYTGPKLFVKPAAKSNRGIIVNAINTVLAGAVNAETKRKVIEEINRSESKHFLILFRDAGCQFRAIYSYNPEREEVIKMYGIGPKAISDHMMDRFYKYNSGGKCFSEVQTKHLTVTIDAFTIPNSLWAGKKVIPPKKEFF